MSTVRIPCDCPSLGYFAEATFKPVEVSMPRDPTAVDTKVAHEEIKCDDCGARYVVQQITLTQFWNVE